MDLDKLSVRVTHAQIAGPDDQRVYFAVRPKGVFRWASAAGEVVRLFEQDTHVTGLSVSPDKRRIVTLGGSTALVRALPGGKKELELKHPLTASGAAIVPGGRLLTSCYDGLVRLWDLSGGRELFAFDLGMGKIYSLAVSPDHMTFAAGAQKKSRIVLMDVPE